MFFVKLSTSSSKNVMSTLCNVRKVIIYSVQYPRQALIENFVSLHPGMKHVTWTHVKNYTRPLGKRLIYLDYEKDTVILVVDSDYFYIQKNTKFFFKRRFFSLNKEDLCFDYEVLAYFRLHFGWLQTLFRRSKKRWC